MEVWDEDDVVDCYIGGAVVEIGSLDRSGVACSMGVCLCQMELKQVFGAELSLLNRQGAGAGKLEVRLQLRM